MNQEQITLGGKWGLAIIMIVVASWVLYKYLAPKTWKEWRSAGIVQAFIIALYAEMYGFPLTIYILSAVFGINIPWLHMRGHLWATLLGYGDVGALIEMIIGLSIVAVGLILIVRGWHLIYRTRHEDRLVTEGVYQYIRHPQYTGIYLVVFGQIVHWPTILTLILFPFIVIAYYRLARREEKDLTAKFGEPYRHYMEQVPMFFPRFRNWPAVLIGK